MATRRDHPDHGPDDSVIRNPEVSYEHRDMGARNILVFLIILGICGIAIHVLIYGMYRGMQKYAEAHDPQLHPLTPKDTLQRPVIVPANVPVNLQKFPEPRLQSDDVTDMRTFLTQEERLLDAQPWKDEGGTVHISIDRAKELITQRGLPARNAPTPAEAYEGAGVANASGQPPADQSDSGNISFNQIEQPTDAVAVPGAPKGDTMGPSKEEEYKPIPGVNPNEPRNPSRGRGEKQPR